MSKQRIPDEDLENVAGGMVEGNDGRGYTVAAHGSGDFITIRHRQHGSARISVEDFKQTLLDANFSSGDIDRFVTDIGRRKNQDMSGNTQRDMMRAVAEQHCT